MTTNIESALADMLEGLSVSDGYYQLSIGRVGTVKLAERIVKNEPDLLDALGAVSTADMAREIAEAQCEANEWKARAEIAEASLDAAREIIGRVRALLVFGTIEGDELRTALDPKPAFTLPAEAGVVIEYTDHDGGKQLWFRTRDTQRPWTDREGNTWHDAGLARDIAGDFTVLLGADQ